MWLYGDPIIATGDVYHPWAEQAQALVQRGRAVFSDIDALGQDYDAVFVNCPKQREETEGLLALALDRSNGFVMCAADNDAGGGRLEGMMQAYGAVAQKLSKSKARVVWTIDARRADRALVKQNLAYLAPQQINLEGESWWSVPGLFGWDKIDPGSRLLLKHLPENIHGKVADFGSGYGYLSVMLARNFQAVTKIDAYDADIRAVVCSARNGGEKINAVWQDICTLEAAPLYDTIVMNPPFHSGKEEKMVLGTIFIRKAWDSLLPGGRLLMVANRHLAYEKIVTDLTVAFEGEGYKIMTGQK